MRPGRNVLTVSALTTRIRKQLEAALPTVWVEGELSNCRRWKTGHLYFTLKDAAAQIQGVMFRSAYLRLRFDPSDGQRVVARGRIGVYEPKGEYQLVAEHLEPFGVGARQAAYDRLRQRLEREGLFDEARKRRLPTLPRKIGIVTSLDGAVLRDILHVLRRRFPDAHVVIAPTAVQGDGAARQVTGALARLARVDGIDVVILARGGGSTEDLWAFNDEGLARTIASLDLPVISAVGHQTDYTIADFVADKRAATPSAAAELVMASKAEFEAHLGRTAERLRVGIRTALDRRRVRLDAARHRPGFAAFPTRLALHGHRLDELTRRLAERARADIDRRRRRSTALRQRFDALDVRRRLDRIRTALAVARERLPRAARDDHAARRRRLLANEERLLRAVGERRDRARRRLEPAAAKLDAVNPLRVLARGYAVCRRDDKRTIVRRASDVAVGDLVRIDLHEGALQCNVTAREQAPGKTR